MSAPKQPKQDGREERHQGLTIERYGEVVAYRRHFPPAYATEVLLRLGIQPWQWEAATRAWGAELASALTRDEPETITRFSRAFSTTERRLREFPPRIESLGERVALQAAPLPSSHVEAGPALPSYMSEGAARAQWQAPPLAPAPPPAPAARPVPPPAPPSLGATADISAFVPRHMLPFSAQGASPPAAPAPVQPQGTPSPAQAAPSPPAPRPGMILRRFDPETGEPLAAPVWEEPPR